MSIASMSATQNQGFLPFQFQNWNAKPTTLTKILVFTFGFFNLIEGIGANSIKMPFYNTLGCDVIRQNPRDPRFGCCQHELNFRHQEEFYQKSPYQWVIDEGRTTRSLYKWVCDAAHDNEGQCGLEKAVIKIEGREDCDDTQFMIQECICTPEKCDWGSKDTEHVEMLYSTGSRAQRKIDSASSSNQFQSTPDANYQRAQRKL